MEATKDYTETEYPIIGFQGQLVPHKGLPRVITQVQKEFKKQRSDCSVQITILVPENMYESLH